MKLVLTASSLGASASAAAPPAPPAAGAPPYATAPPNTLPNNSDIPYYPTGHNLAIASCYKNQLGLLGGQVPLSNYLIPGQSIFNFIKSIFVVFKTLSFMQTDKYLDSKTFNSNKALATNSTLFLEFSSNS